MTEIDPTKLRALARVHPVAWAMLASEGQWRRAKHLTVLARYLMMLHTGEIKRLAVSFPPRHGKSELISKHFLTWWLGSNPTDNIVISSYGRDLTTQWTRDARDMFAQFAPAVFGLDTWTRSSVNNWHAFRGGKRTGGEVFGIGRGGGLTGRGADLLVIDDPVRDSTEANSASARSNIMDWIKSVALTRLSPGGRCVVIQTRWHTEDPIGQFMQQQEAGEAGEPWTFLNFPAICEDETSPLEIELGRSNGDALWPERFDVAALEKIKKDVGSAVWSALYMGHPTPLDGGLFKREYLRYCTQIGDELTMSGEPPVKLRECKLFATADLACSLKDRADYTAIGVWAMHIKRRKLFLIDLKRKRLEGPDIVPLLEQVCKEHKLVEIGLEVGSFQNTISQEARRKGLPVHPLKPDKDKFTRATAATAPMEAGCVYFRVGLPHLNALETELLTFPNGTHDDCVDMLSYAVIRFLKVIHHSKQRRGTRQTRL